MQDSLKSKLFDEIKRAYPNMFSLERVELLAKQNGYKISNAERRLRELCDGENPSVRPIRTEKGHIMGYIYIEPPRPVIMNKPKQQTLLDVRMRD